MQYALFPIEARPSVTTFTMTLLVAVGSFAAGVLGALTGLGIALGLLLGAYIGARIGVPLSPRTLKRSFAVFLVGAAALTWARS